jgi:hypothetical protein
MLAAVEFQSDAEVPPAPPPSPPPTTTAAAAHYYKITWHYVL